MNLGGNFGLSIIFSNSKKGACRDVCDAYNARLQRRTWQQKQVCFRGVKQQVFLIKNKMFF